MYKKICLALINSSLSIGCSTLGSYSYTDSSNPKFPKKYSNQNEVSGSIDDPLDGVCHLTTTRKNYKTMWLGNTPYNGSAALIDGRYLITAAHNVYDYPLNYLTSVSVSCGVKSVSNNTIQVKLNREQIKNSISVPRYEFKVFNQEKKYEFDYAFIDLGEKITQNSGFHVPKVSMLEVGNTVNISGYPGRPISDGHTLHKGVGSIKDINGNLASYSINTATGNSGGPIWVNDSKNNYLVAVHVKNSGGRIVNKSLIDDWKEWLNTRSN